MTTSEAQVQRAIETLRERHRLTIDGDWGQTCNWDEFNWPCDTAIVLDAAIARAEAAERVVEAARTFRHASRHGQMIGDVFDAIDVFREVVREHDAATAASESEATP